MYLSPKIFRLVVLLAFVMAVAMSQECVGGEGACAASDSSADENTPEVATDGAPEETKSALKDDQKRKKRDSDESGKKKRRKMI